MPCDNLVERWRLGVGMKILALVIDSGLMASRNLNDRNIWRKSLFKICKCVFNLYLHCTSAERRVFENTHYFDPFVKSLISRCPVNPSVQSFHFLSPRCFTKHFIFSTEISGRSTARMLNSFDALIQRSLCCCPRLKNVSKALRTSSLWHFRYCSPD